MPEPVGCIFEQEDGNLIAGCRSGLRTVPDGRLIVPLPPGPHPVRINDGKVDPQGRLVFGTMGYPNATPGVGALWRYDGNRLVKLRANLTIPNGLDWIDDGQTMLFIDTPNRVIKPCPYTPDGERLAWSAWRDTYNQDGLPDGMIATDEHILVAMWSGGLILQLNFTGTSRTLPVPARFATSVVQHPDGDSALVTTACPQKVRERRKHELGGAILRLAIT